MFNETTLGDMNRFPIKAFQDTCNSPSMLVDVGGDAPVCLTASEYAAYQSSEGGGVNVTPKAADSWTNYVIYGGLALLAFALVSGGRR